MVRVPSSTRVGPTFFIAGWCAGANMKPMPALSMHSPTWAALSSILTPSAPSTSAAPERDDRARLPCFATGTPAPATMKAAQVEMLKEPDASPPVPTTSIASGGASTLSILARMAVTAPVISSTSRRARAAPSAGRPSARASPRPTSCGRTRARIPRATAWRRRRPCAIRPLKSSTTAAPQCALRRCAFQCAASSRKFFRIRWPCSDAMLSG